MTKKEVVGRNRFIRKLMDAGFKFDEAVVAYDTFLSTIADGIINGQPIYVGNIGSIVPVVCPPRQVNMGCQKLKGGEVVRIKREFYLDTRLKYKFRLFKKFVSTHQLSWHSS